MYGGKFYKSHDLNSLRWHCQQQQELPTLSELMLKELTEHYEGARYKGKKFGRQDAEEALAMAEQVKHIILANVPNSARPDEARDDQDNA